MTMDIGKDLKKAVDEYFELDKNFYGFIELIMEVDY